MKKTLLFIFILIVSFSFYQCKDTIFGSSSDLTGDWRITVHYTDSTCPAPFMPPDETFTVHLEQNGNTLSGETDEGFGIIGTVDDDGNFTISYDWWDEEMHYTFEATGTSDGDTMSGTGTLLQQGTEDGEEFNCTVNFTFTGEKI